MNKEILLKELSYKAVRSSGAGGQHVNKVSSKIVLVFDVMASEGLTLLEKEKIYLKLANRLSKENILLLQCDESRSQHKNKELVLIRFFELLEKALKVAKKRKATKPSKSSIEKRLKSKKKAAEKKLNRTKRDWT
ncbi:alternative ribosome rescue aminoacyl-tRNA hydrolase ArfB [Cellulophaga tyrosinoxydans]|uniref:Ribosome-associated protein n=1 Tax=Cellulophaga tyrosinoxydans TaxID=504486 RepID=A0A1W1YXJ9_9FLAO|nr:alternative ribosome rescue aminoacyl-tRNA hydrolase ArfB [Cellulophaga tyrosinoxydans]SMC40919.1 ribosome-associated protein [Cellulophaga tyrosinoxydans]